MAADLTLGLEEELHLIDTDSGKLSGKAPQVLSSLPADNYSAELQRTTVEINTNVVMTLDDLRADMLRLRKGLIDVAERSGLSVAAVGTAPRSEYADFELTTNGRYGRMQEQYRLLVDEQLICGTHIHAGVDDRDLAVQIAQRIQRYLPSLLALSASSPYWNGQDTGYASIRTIIWQRWPSSGSTGPLQSAEEYDALVRDLMQTGVIADEKMAYFDVRPSSHRPTLELRVCDACPVVDDAVLIAGLYRAAVHSIADDIEKDVPFRPVAAPLQRAALWQAARGGLSGNLLSLDPRSKPVPAGVAIRDVMNELRPYLEEFGDWEQVVDLADAALTRGNSTDRQRAVFAETGALDDVVKLVVDETRGPADGLPPAVPALRTYPSRAGDEAVGPGSRPRETYGPIVGFFRGLEGEALREREERRDETARSMGLTFRSGEVERTFTVDLLPRLISGAQWDQLRAGLLQRSRAIECFLQDAYGEGRIFREGVIPRDFFTSSPGWRDEATRLPPGTVRAPIMGFDLVRNEMGGWRVLEDNLRSPSGIAYAIAARELLNVTVPELLRPQGLRDPRTAFEGLRRTFSAEAPGGTFALLSPGNSSSAWYEHQRLADGSGLIMTTPADLTVTDDVVRIAASGRRVDALYLRIDDELVDIATPSSPHLGEEIMAAAAAGNVYLANAPGNGIADDKASYCFVPELISYYLDERPLLESVPTYRPAEESDLRIVLERVGDLVTKPVDGFGGEGVLIGPSATAREVAERREEIAAAPDRWVAQEVVPLSSHPAFTDGTLEPRHIDLRAFVFVRGTEEDEVELADVALTRVAASGSMIVNSSRGGGAKDTWIVGAADAKGGRHVRTRR